MRFATGFVCVLCLAGCHASRCFISPLIRRCCSCSVIVCLIDPVGAVSGCFFLLPILTGLTLLFRHRICGGGLSTMTGSTQRLVITGWPEQNICLPLYGDDVIDDDCRCIDASPETVDTQRISFQKMSAVFAPAVGVTALCSRSSSAVALTAGIPLMLVTLAGLHPFIASRLCAPA